MLKILIVDDEISRIINMKKLLTSKEEKEVLVAKNVYEAENILDHNNYFDTIYLDYDLGLASCPLLDKVNNGVEVAKLMVAKKTEYKRCVIHTMNEPGSQQILSILNGNAELIPYVFLREV